MTEQIEDNAGGAEKQYEYTAEQGFKLFESIQETLKSSHEIRAQQVDQFYLFREKLCEAQKTAEENQLKSSEHMEAMQHHLWMHFAHFLNSVSERVHNVIEAQKKLKEFEAQKECYEEARAHREILNKQTQELLVSLAEAKAKHQFAKEYLFKFQQPEEDIRKRLNESYPSSTIYPKLHPTPPSSSFHGGEKE